MKQLNSGDELLAVFEALAHPLRLKIIEQLTRQQQYVSQLARDVGISRPLLYLHLKKLEEANLIQGHSEILESGKAAKYYTLQPFDFDLNARLIAQLAPSLTLKKKKE